MPWLASWFLRNDRQQRDVPQQTPREHTELIRAAMLAALDDACPHIAETVVRRIRHAGDAERLWHLRCEVMSVLASALGEARARDRIRKISVLFQEVLPHGLASQLGTLPLSH